jgi:exodeoxyribonuclease VII large subunit
MQPAEDRPLTVAALARACSRLLEEKVGWVRVEGEISGLKIPASGHVYFNLKDKVAQVPAMMWRRDVMRLRFRLEEGMHVVVRGRPSVYPEQGRFQLYVESAEPVGLGAAALALEQLKKKLGALGYFDPAKKRRLPRFPRRIGVVTSTTGAAVRDIIRAVERRFPTPIVVAPTRVQGEQAGIQIAWAIRRVAKVPGIDVIIVGRGGGSSEDLSAFNEECVVREIAVCPVPVISAVGHEVDVTLADLAADVRAATPTAAGEIAVPDRVALAEELAAIEKRIGRAARTKIDGLRARIDRPAARIEALVRGRVHAQGRALDGLARRLAAVDPRARLGADRAKLDALLARATQAVRAGAARRRAALGAASSGLDAMSPLRVLDRGYAIARLPDGTVVTKRAQVAPGDELDVRVSDGEIRTKVTE